MEHPGRGITLITSIKVLDMAGYCVQKTWLSRYNNCEKYFADTNVTGVNRTMKLASKNAVRLQNVVLLEYWRHYVLHFENPCDYLNYSL